MSDDTSYITTILCNIITRHKDLINTEDDLYDLLKGIEIQAFPSVISALGHTKTDLTQHALALATLLNQPILPADWLDQLTAERLSKPWHITSVCYRLNPEDRRHFLNKNAEQISKVITRAEDLAGLIILNGVNVYETLSFMRDKLAGIFNTLEAFELLRSIPMNQDVRTLLLEALGPTLAGLIRTEKDFLNIHGFFSRQLPEDAAEARMAIIAPFQELLANIIETIPGLYTVLRDMDKRPESGYETFLKAIEPKLAIIINDKVDAMALLDIFLTLPPPRDNDTTQLLLIRTLTPRLININKEDSDSARYMLNRTRSTPETILMFLAAYRDQLQRMPSYSSACSRAFCKLLLDQPQNPGQSRFTALLAKMTDARKLYAVCDGLLQLKTEGNPKVSTDSIKDALQNPESALYQALNIKRHFSFTFYGPAGFFQDTALSLQKAREIFPAEPRAPQASLTP